MREYKLKRKFWIITTIFMIVFGTLLHFTYAWSGNNFIVGFFSAVNESVWEHMKMLFTPSLVILMITTWILNKRRSLPQAYLFAQVIGLLCGMLFLIAFFYTYTGAFGVEEILVVDTISFFIGAMITQGVTVCVNNRLSSKRKSWQALGVFLWIFLLVIIVLWTIYPPNLPLFQSA